MYGQEANKAASDNYETNSSHKNTTKYQLASEDKMALGHSYWIITDANRTITIDKSISGLSPANPMKDANDSNYQIDNPNFKQMIPNSIPNNEMNTSGNIKKYMAGNILPYQIDMSNIYFSHGLAGGSYHSMLDTTDNDTYIQDTFYKHDSNETGPVTGYVSVKPSTPGFNAPIEPMEGFFIKINEVSNHDGNALTYPLTFGNDK